MSDLWDYDDDDDLGDGGAWDLPSPTEVVFEHEEASSKKRKGGRKAGNMGPRSKRRAPSPIVEVPDLQQALRPTTVFLDSDDDDDMVVLPSPCRAAPAGPAERPAGPSSRVAMSNLDPATQQALAKEHALLQALQQVTEMQHQPLDDLDPGPMPRASRLPLLGLSRPISRLPLDTRGSGGGTSTSTSQNAASCGGHAEAAEAAGPANGPGGSHQPPPSNPDGAASNAAAATVAAVAPAAAAPANRVLLKLVWGCGREGHLTMGVVRTDPFSKMMEKFREIATQRFPGSDPKKIKFMFDGDDLAQTPTATPESLDMEDDMIIDVKL